MKSHQPPRKKDLIENLQQGHSSKTDPVGRAQLVWTLIIATVFATVLLKQFISSEDSSAYQLSSTSMTSVGKQNASFQGTRPFNP